MLRFQLFTVCIGKFADNMSFIRLFAQASAIRHPMDRKEQVDTVIDPTIPM
jgi:hypothetical protein